MGDHYVTLQVDPGADPEVIEAAYRRLAQKWHPDRSADPAAAARMRDINEAYRVLGDPGRRRAYDARRQRVPGRGGGKVLQQLASGAVVVAVVIGTLFAMRFLGFLVRMPLLLLIVAVAVYALFQRGRERRDATSRRSKRRPS